jgi:hypothetical protein
MLTHRQAGIELQAHPINGGYSPDSHSYPPDPRQHPLEPDLVTQQDLVTQHSTLLDESARLAETARKLELNAAADAPVIAQNIRVPPPPGPTLPLPMTS